MIDVEFALSELCWDAFVPLSECPSRFPGFDRMFWTGAVYGLIIGIGAALFAELWLSKRATQIGAEFMGVPPPFRAEGILSDGQPFQPQFFYTEAEAIAWAASIGATITRSCRTEDMSAESLERQSLGC
jgi:hypothetical protein